MRCVRHGIDFRLPDECSGCGADPAHEEEDSIGAPVAAPDGCRSVEDHERWYTSLANECLAEVKELSAAGERTWHTEGIIAKHREVALKANRAAVELTRRRTDEALVDARERRIRDRARGAGH